MSWIPFNEFTPGISAYLFSIGKALLIAQSFEHNCRHILLLSEADLLEDSLTLDAAKVLSEKIRKRQIGQIVWRMQHPSLNFSEIEISILENGRQARNFFAHEAALCAYWSLEGSEEFAKDVDHFILQLEHLITAHNETSAWCYEAEEKQSRPPYYERYPADAKAWVLDPLVIAGVVHLSNQ